LPASIGDIDLTDMTSEPLSGYSVVPSVAKRFDPLEIRDAHGKWTHGSLKATVEELRKHGDSTERHAGGEDGYSPERRALHHSIVQRSLAGHERKAKPVAVFMGGGAGAGKSSIDGKKRGAVVDADAYKEKLPEYQALKESGEKDAAGYTYREGSRMAQDAVTEATDHGLDFTLDGAGGGGYDSMKERTDNARRGGHHVHAVYVTTDTNEAVRRANLRGDKDGRYIPEPIIRATHASVTNTFREGVERGGLFDSAELWDNNGSEPKLIGEMKPGQKFQVHDDEAWQRFLAKEHEQ
jgi:predicted ABC-type ATPase